MCGNEKLFRSKVEDGIVRQVPNNMPIKVGIRRA